MYNMVVIHKYIYSKKVMKTLFSFELKLKLTYKGGGHCTIFVMYPFNSLRSVDDNKKKLNFKVFISDKNTCVQTVFIGST